MFLPRALKVKRPAEGSAQVVVKKSKVVQEEDSKSSSETPAQSEEACEDTQTRDATTHAAAESLAPEDGHSSLSDDSDVDDDDDDDEEEPVKSFKKNQRWPGPGEPVCVMCGRYGEYICDATDNDVCSLECKASHLVQMGMGTGADAFMQKDQNRHERTVQSQQPAADPGRVVESEPGYSYREDRFISGLTEEQVQRIKQELGIETQGRDVARPVVEFEHCSFPPTLSGNLKKAGYDTPTPVQIQMVPVGLTGRDVIASADTGSGKTVAFLLPVVVRALEVQY